MSGTTDRILCRTPSAGKQPTRIERWKFDAVRGAVLAALEDSPDGVQFSDLPKEVSRRLSPDQRKRLGSISW